MTRSPLGLCLVKYPGLLHAITVDSQGCTVMDAPVIVRRQTKHQS